MAKTPKSTPALPDRSLGHLLDALAAPQAAGVHAHHKRSDLLAATYRPCQRSTDRIPDERVPFDAFRLLALTHRWTEGVRGQISRKVVLAIYRPVVDLPGSGRIRFACEAALPVGARPARASPDPRRNPTAARAAALMHRAIEDAGRRELTSALDLPAFYYAFRPDRPPAYEAAIPPATWAARMVRIGDLIAWPAEFFARPTGRRWEGHPVPGPPCTGQDGDDLTTGDDHDASAPAWRATPPTRPTTAGCSTTSATPARPSASACRPIRSTPRSSWSSCC
jgi:hypothetical protein